MEVRKLFICTLCAAFFVQAADAAVSEWVVKPIYTFMEPISESLIRVKTESLTGIIDYSGRQIVPCAYDLVTEFHDGYCLLLTSSYKLMGIVDTRGRVRKVEKDLWVDRDYPFVSEGMLAVKLSNGAWTYLAPDMSFPIKDSYRSAYPFAYGYALVRHNSSSGVYLHISKGGNISRLSSDFSDNDICFASSFSNIGGRKLALVMDGRQNVYLRDDNGYKVKALGRYVSYSRETRSMTLSNMKIIFNSRHCISEVKKGSSSSSKYEEEDLPRYIITNPVLRTRQIDSKIALYKDGTELVPAQFDFVAPLSETTAIAEVNGRLGLLEVRADAAISLSEAVSRNNVQHSIPMTVSLMPVFPSSELASKCRFVVKKGDNIIYDGIPGQGPITLTIQPQLSDGADESMLSIVPFVGTVEQPHLSHKTVFTYNNDFTVSVPSSVALVENNTMGKFSIVVRNNSSQQSAPCTIRLNGRALAENKVIDPGQKISLPVVQSVDLQDMDYVNRTFLISVDERGCPEYKSSQTIKFERTF